MAAAASVTTDPGHLAKVIELPLPSRSCTNCANAVYLPTDQGETWCNVYSEVIDCETYAAEDCFTYERVVEGSQPVLADDPREDF